MICLQLIACSHSEQTSRRLRSLEDVISGQAAHIADLSAAMRGLQQELHRPSLSSSKLSDASILISLQYDSRTVPFSVKRTRQISEQVTRISLPCQPFGDWPTTREYLIRRLDGIPQISCVTFSGSSMATYVDDLHVECGGLRRRRIWVLHEPDASSSDVASSNDDRNPLISSTPVELSVS